MANAAKKPKKVNVLSEETKKRKRESDKVRARSRINIGPAFARWRELRDEEGCPTDGDLAVLLLDHYFQTRPDQPGLENTSAETCGNEHSESISSSNEGQQEANHGKRMVTNPSDNKENGVGPDDDEKVSMSLSVGDGHYLVDLGSSSEFIVDEECLLELFKSCWECNKQCTVRQQAKGLKVVINQACCFCESQSKWTNLPEKDEDSL
ncbi:uncharacterized protein LOC114443538 isoform X2 [Parambassis ranga]|uniref:Uncharacterized protein LOC114443538 isoform X2 n=1 Tax=Parambassis ranga TaxID=210632 RepID=A0A6P7JBS5_9TELE|nr:uncharacterized protein LOC114443538 isoform X2 [Parambassis ranga]